jgi:hypothetical protein
MRQGLHGYRMVRLEFNDPKVLFVGLAYLVVCGSYAYRVLRELPYLKNVLVPLRNVLKIRYKCEDLIYGTLNADGVLEFRH